MARIEISLDEYNKLKDTITKLEQDNNKKEKEIQNLNVILDEIYDEVDVLVNETALFDRIFKWKETIQNLEEILEKYETK